MICNKLILKIRIKELNISRFFTILIHVFNLKCFYYINLFNYYVFLLTLLILFALIKFKSSALNVFFVHDFMKCDIFSILS